MVAPNCCPTKLLWDTGRRCSRSDHDFVYALRTLLRSPGYALVTVLTLALGIGANAAIFSVVNGVMLKPLAYPDPGRLVFITSQFPKLGFNRFWMSTAEFLEFKERNHSFENVGAYREGSVNLGAVDRPRRVNSAIVTPELLPVLGVQPLSGRVFTAADSCPAPKMSPFSRARRGKPTSVAMRPSSIASFLSMASPTRVVGIMPPGYDIHDERVEIWQPLTIDPARTPNHAQQSLPVFSRAIARRRHARARGRRSRNDAGAVEIAESVRPRTRTSRASAADAAVEDRSGERHRHRVVGSARCGGLRPADCLRQSGESPPRQSRVAAAGVRDPLSPRCRSMAAAPAVPDRRRRARADRRCYRRGGGIQRAARSARGQRRQHSARG